MDGFRMTGNNGNNDLPPHIQAQVDNSTNILKARILGLTLTALDEAEKMMRSGNPATKMKVMQSVIPSLVKSLTQQEEAQELDQMREDMDKLRAQVFGEVEEGVVVEVGDVEVSTPANPASIPSDMPPHPLPNLPS